MIPQKFNKKLWLRRGGFVVVEESEAAAEDTKVTGNIVTVGWMADSVGVVESSHSHGEDGIR